MASGKDILTAKIYLSEFRRDENGRIIRSDVPETRVDLRCGGIREVCKSKDEAITRARELRANDIMIVDRDALVFIPIIREWFV